MTTWEKRAAEKRRLAEQHRAGAHTDPVKGCDLCWVQSRTAEQREADDAVLRGLFE